LHTYEYYIKRQGSIASIPASYSVGPRLESRSEGWHPGFGFPQSLQVIAGTGSLWFTLQYIILEFDDT